MKTKESNKVRPRKPHKQVSGESGRVALYQRSNKKARKDQPKLCVGCGTQVVLGVAASGAAGGNEVAAVVGEQTKRAAKRSRYMDVLDTAYGADFLCDRCKVLQKSNENLDPLDYDNDWENAESNKNPGIWKAYDTLADVSPEVFRNQLQHIINRRQFGMCLAVVDATDPEHSAIKNLRRCIGNLPCWVVLAKKDLVPRMDENDTKFLKHRIDSISSTNSLECFAVSAKTGEGMFNLAQHLLANLRGRDVFVVGSANVGKSTLVKELASMIGEFLYFRGKNRAAQKRRDLMNKLQVTASNLPGTTLQAVRIPCFPSALHALWDTPGIINRKAVQYSIFPSHLMEPLTRPAPIKLPLKDSANYVGNLPEGMSLLVESTWMGDPPCVLARLDMVRVEDGVVVMTEPYLHPSLRVRIVPTSRAPDRATIPAAHIQRISRLMQTKFPREEYSLPLCTFAPYGDDCSVTPSENERPGGKRYRMDIQFASLGWISFTHKWLFSVVPHCVQGSVFSKRRSIYPFLMKPEVCETYEGDEMRRKDIRRHLKDAAEKGRHGETEQPYKSYESW